MNQHTSRYPWASSFALLLAVAADACLAQSATPGAAITLGPVVVTGAADSSEAASVERRFEALPGGVTLIRREDQEESANPTVSRALGGVPGVVVQDFFGGNDQPGSRSAARACSRTRSSAAC